MPATEHLTTPTRAGRTVPTISTCPSPAGKPTQTVRLAGGRYHV